MPTAVRAIAVPRRPGFSPLPASFTPIWLLAVAAILAVPAVVASAVDLGGRRDLWDNLHWTATSLAAAAATAWSVRGTSGRVRTMRSAAAVAFSLWLIANVLWAVLDLVAAATVPSVADAFVFAIVVPGVVVLVTTIRGRMTVAEEIAVYLDAGLVIILIASILLHIHGPEVLALPGMAGVVALAYPVAFIGLAAAGLVALLATGYPVSIRGSMPLLLGSALVGVAYLGWTVPTASGANAGVLSSVLFTTGTLVSAAGAVTWTDARSADPVYRRRARYVARIVGPTVASLLLLLILIPVPASIDLVLRVCLFIGGVVFVIREGLLLKERSEMLVAVTSLTDENSRLVGELQHELARRARDERRLIQASRAAAVGELAAGVAHEVNNPLTGVLGFAELILDDLPADDPHREDLVVIRTEALRARQIVQSLREFAAPTAPALALTDLAELVNRTVDLMRYAIVSRGVRLVVDLREMPPVEVDPHAIQQALLNVLTNAAQAVADDGRIEVALRRDGPEVVLSVQDDGVGMDEATLAAAREPFFSGRPEELGVPPSRGLGLSTSSGLVESHGGTITLASAPGRGTVVDIRLPASSEGSQVHREQNR